MDRNTIIQGGHFISKKEALYTTTATGKFMLTIFGAVAELGREYILQRQREGIAIAKHQGKNKEHKRIENQDLEKVVSRWRNGDITATMARGELRCLGINSIGG